MHKICLLTLTLAFALPACRAEDSVKQGVDGEFCNGGNDDCREGHVCENFRCHALNAAASITCGAMCERLQECNAAESDCESRCRVTFEGECDTIACPWSAEAIQAFGECITEDLTCDQAQDSSGPQVCYSRLPLPAERKARCDSFLGAADRCSDGNRDQLRNNCYRLGRTATEASWQRTDGCVDRIAGGICSDAISCLNTVFELTPQLGVTNESF